MKRLFLPFFSAAGFNYIHIIDRREDEMEHFALKNKQLSYNHSELSPYHRNFLKIHLQRWN